MVEQGIVLGHIISNKGIEVDPKKILLFHNCLTPLACERCYLFLVMQDSTGAL